MMRVIVGVVVFLLFASSAQAWTLHGAVWHGVKAVGTHCPAPAVWHGLKSLVKHL